MGSGSSALPSEHCSPTQGHGAGGRQAPGGGKPCPSRLSARVSVSPQSHTPQGNIREQERSGLGVIFTAKSGVGPEPPSEVMLQQPQPQALLGSPARGV